MTRIKICGITRLEDALAASVAGADALGFNFSRSSPRLIPPDVVREIVSKLPPLVTPVGVFVEQEPEEIDEICRYCRLQVAQLHSDDYTPAEALAVTAARVIRVFRPGPGFSIDEVREFSRLAGCNAFLFDAYSPAMAGGTGLMIASSTAVGLFDGTRDFSWSLLAGGLRPNNVAEAVRVIRPWGVDTASGVESAPGVKDRALLEAFVEAVRQADRSIRSAP
ncbi:MAG: phosphoribosylanthranilate isomerase [Chlorobiaceae bacterium]|nr:phosphoribosylanthranilate isomerase [Chlorobiaceae bacterium]